MNSTGYALHFNPRAGEWDVYNSRAPHTAHLVPACKIRGTKEVTSVKASVTCGACRAKMSK